MIVGGSFSWSLPYNIKWLEATDEVNWCFINQVDFSYNKKKSVQFRKARMSPDWSIFKYTYICIKSCKLMNSALVEDVLYALNAFSTPLRKI